MAIGKEIKVVLSLDDSGFSIKTRSAAEIVKTFQGNVAGLSKTTDQMETNLASAARELKNFTDGFAGMQKSLQSTVEALSRAVTGGFDRINQSARESAKVARDAAVAQIDAKTKTLNAELTSNRKLLEARGKMHADLRKLESDERAKAMQAELAAEKATRSKKAGSGVVAAEAMEEAKRYTANANALRQQIAATEQWINTARTAQAARTSEIASLENERKAAVSAAQAKESLAKVSAAVGKSNASEIARVRKVALEEQKASDMAAAKSSEDLARLKKQYAEQEVRDRRAAEEAIRRENAETARLQRQEARDAAAETRREAQAIAQMWRGMAAAYGGAKITQGLGMSVDQAGQTERAKFGVGALNLAPDEEQRLFSDSEKMAKSLKFLSTLEAIQSRMSAIASLGYNNEKIISQTLDNAVKAANNLQTLGMAHGDLQNTIRNLYGVIEMRQQQGDAVATNATFDTMQKIIVGTAGKVQTQDMETVLRRMGMGANQLSDKGFVNLAAVVDQFKVAGGDGGGSSGGVSTVGTAFKMMQAYALGKGLSNTAVKEFAGAGVLSDTGIDLSKDSAGVLRDAKHGGFKDADLWLKDPVSAVQKIMPQILEYTKSDKQRTKYYQGRDMNNLDNELVAVSMYLARLGITTTASQALMVAGDPRSKERIAHQAQTIEKTDTAGALNDRLDKGYDRELQEAKAALTDLSSVIGTALLPIVKTALNFIQDIARAVTEFAKNNPMATQFTAIAAAVGGAVLSVKGFMMLFGTSGLMGVLRSFLGMAPQVAGAATTLVGGGSGFGALVRTLGEGFSSLTTWIGSLILRIPVLGTMITKLGQAFSVGGGLIKSMGGIFKGVAGVLLAWDVGTMIGDWIREFKVGTLTIGEHFQNMLLSIEVSWKKLLFSSQEYALKIRKFFGIDSQAEYDTKMAEVATNRAALVEFERSMKITEKPQAQVDAEAAKRKKDAADRKKALEDADKEMKARNGKSDPKAMQGVIDAADTAGKRRGDRDPLTAALENAKGDIAAQQEKLKAIVIGAETVESLRRQAAETIEGKRKAAEYSPNRDPKKIPAANDPKIIELKEAEFQRLLQAEQIKAIEFANQRVAATADEADAAMERMATGGVAKQTEAFRALSRELERAEMRLGAGVEDFDKWVRAKNAALFNQAVGDAANMAADYRQKNKEGAAGLLPTERERIAAQLAAEREKEDGLFNMRLNTLQKTRDAELKFAETAEQTANINISYLTAKEGLEQEYAARKAIRTEEELRQTEDAVAQMTRQWKDYGAEIDQIGADAASGFVDMLTSTLGTGRLKVGEFVVGVLQDIAAAKLKQVLADPLKDIVQQGTGWVKQNIFGMAGDASATAAATARATADSAAASASVGMAVAVANATLALQIFAAQAAQASGANVGGFIGSLINAAGAGGGAVGPASGTPTNVLFADGGIMTDIGPVELRKYANGGIANSPQAAVFGEGSMPEAYVPLPDGRSIPVTMQGGGQPQMPSVQVNVINQTGQAANAQQGNLRFDGKQFVLDVVMTAASTPGPFRQNLKEAMK